VQDSLWGHYTSGLPAVGIALPAASVGNKNEKKKTKKKNKKNNPQNHNPPHPPQPPQNLRNPADTPPPKSIPRKKEHTKQTGPQKRAGEQEEDKDKRSSQAAPTPLCDQNSVGESCPSTLQRQRGLGLYLVGQKMQSSDRVHTS